MQNLLAKTLLRLVQNKGTDLIFNSISKKEVQGVTGGADTSGISNKESRGEREAKSRQLGCSVGLEEERERGASLVGPNRAQASPPRARGQALALPWAQHWGHPSLGQAQAALSSTREALGEW